MKPNERLMKYACLSVALGVGAMLKLYYSNAHVDDLRWILAPTAFLVELFSGTRFTFESGAGYMSGDHTFLIAASCSGVNFLITAYLMLILAAFWRGSLQTIKWRLIPASALAAYITTLAANTFRIGVALWLRDKTASSGWIDPDDLHRMEGILVYFGFLLLLYTVSEMTLNDTRRGFTLRYRLLRIWALPLLIYYTMTLGIPLVNGAWRQGRGFLEHSLFVLLTPLLIVLLAVLLFYLKRLWEIRQPIQVTGELEV